MYSPHTGFQQCLTGLFNMYASCHINSWNLVRLLFSLFTCSEILSIYIILFSPSSSSTLFICPHSVVLLIFVVVMMGPHFNTKLFIPGISILFLIPQRSSFLLILPPPSLFLSFSILMNFKVHLTSSLSRLYEHPSFPFSHLGPIFVKPRKFWWSARHNV